MMQLSAPTVPGPAAADKVQSALRNRRQIGLWLGVTALCVVALVVVGGLTRLTNSGLSITEWQPILGVIPPLSDAAWQEAFAKYREIPQYTQVNLGIGLDEFKTLYWWEWTHRLLGRTVGFIFLVPALIFAWQGKLERALWPRLALIFVLGGLQGLLGWWMVQSGLSERVSVSQYRLAAHLGLAVLLYGAILWTGFDQLETWHLPRLAQRRFAPLIWLAILLTYLQMLLGSLVAGLHAGLIYNTWPLMDGRWIPDGVFPLDPVWLSAFEDVTTVQFDHRMGAYLIAALVTSLWIAFRRQPGAGPLAKRADLMMLVLLFQVGLGIVTLIDVVPVPLAALHQFGAVLLLTSLLWLAHGLARNGRR